MDLLIPNGWLKEFLETSASVKQIAECLSLCGPSVERVNQTEDDSVYSIEVTTNRVDSASVYGIAREASSILPRFGIKATLLPIEVSFNQKSVRSVGYLRTKVDPFLCTRFSAILLRDVKIKSSPPWMIERLKQVGERVINNVVDISNYVMHELGQPVHTFDYDKISGAEMILRESKKGEEIITLDGKKHILPGGDIVIEDGKGRLIDLAGIMGGLNSAVDGNTKNILLFVQTYNPIKIRKTSMFLAHRTEAAVLFEKALDPELVTLGIKRGIDLFVKLAEGKPEKEILDIYPSPYKPKKFSVKLEFIQKVLGIEISKQDINKMLTPLGFETSWKKNALEVIVPSWRANDIEIPEDIVEEVARIYGYHNLPSTLMEGKIPDIIINTLFGFESKLKNILKGYGGTEVYTPSLVSKNWVRQNAFKLKNPLGSDSEYLRTSLIPSLVFAAKENSSEKDSFHLFEISNVYLPKKGNLPDEKITLAGIFASADFRKSKGIIESLLEELNVIYSVEQEDSMFYSASKRIVFKSGSKKFGELGILKENNFIYYEFDLKLLQTHAKDIKYIPIPKYPAQIEDLTLSLPEKTKIGDLIKFIREFEKFISKIELVDIYQNSYTFRIYYQHLEKTLTNNEVERIRENFLKGVKEKFGALVKS